jgi:hypothetical protein
MNLLKNAWDNKELIADGVKNIVFKDERIEAMYAQRIGICNGCEWNTKNVAGVKYEDLSEAIQQRRGVGEVDIVVAYPGDWCLHCVCSLEIKCRAEMANCPLDPPKWTQVEKQSDEKPIEINIDL